MTAPIVYALLRNEAEDPEFLEWSSNKTQAAENHRHDIPGQLWERIAESAPVVYYSVTRDRWESTDGKPVCQDHATPAPCEFCADKRCACARYSDGSRGKTMCSLHADQDPCLTVSLITGKRRKGSIKRGTCTACGWTG